MHGSGANPRLMAVLTIAATIVAAPALAQERGPFEKGSVGIEGAAALMGETWNLNGHRDAMAEGSAAVWGAVSKRMAVGIEFHHAWIFQPGPGAFVQGLSPLIRWKLIDRPRWDWFFETGPGVSWSDIITPHHGTKFNYLYQGGVGAVRPLGPAGHLIVAYRFFHLSNNGREGKSVNPDFEMMGIYAGWSVYF